ncbi:leucyl-tRNA synthetase [Metallosphaera sedula]|uniref:Leucine--tRNA ligase 2 n=2 Tax=Metallosphaera sedula TaxID=43687 RepID=SYL2_METS5|nr:RecName: Full=Leucine--tRNA ligase 2; AltName: Full=Leucyl-tRNA synthetase 2; Short=LeuRS 2 [Metallosphaera sedula DSM 5348]ABP96080.1 leucyl-tRNA synthetase [Metallosphaera sedula DSM 5348]AIM28064.1 leucyl-tRNA synthetase [Metallosphaera sedula]
MITIPSHEFTDLLNEISKKWQEEWSKNRIFEADPKDQKKFFTTVAFPYPNSPFHLGHGRTYVTGDVYARFMRMKGYNVLFPMGFHFTGTPIITMADDVAKGDKDLLDIFQNIYEIPADVIPKLSDPLFMANYFKEDIKAAMREIGLSIDWRREFTTIDPQFSAFIVWQFSKLQKKGYVVKDTHPVGWCPVHNLPVGMHDTKGDMEPEIGEYVVIFFESKMGALAAATLRPETIFGAVAVWVNPKATYTVAEIWGKKVIVSEKAAEKLKFQTDVKVLEKVSGSDLLKIVAINPITGKEIPILPADFVDPTTATGVVMSVPAHAPFDYFYLKKAKVGIEPIPVVAVEGQGDAPAKDLVESSHPKNDADLKKLTEQLYRLEFNKGLMRSDILRLVKDELRAELSVVAGKQVPEARKMVTDILIQRKAGTKMLEIMNKPVYCRCGNEVVVKILQDQWFLDYGNPEWKAKAKKLLDSMRVIPEETRKDFEYALDWLQKRACARTRGLGTPLPWDKKWIIESLSDSTIYMAYYTLSHKIKEFGLHPSQLTEETWDYIMLGEGDVKAISERNKIGVDALQELRRHFTYWYPLDLRHSGPDLIPNHLSFFIFNHAGIFPENLWPRGVAVNGFILYEGKKMSKSLRNIVPLRKAIRTYGADVIRIALSSLVDMSSDANFTEAGARAIADNLKRFYELMQMQDGSTIDGTPEKWLRSKLHRLVRDVTPLMESMRFREVINELLFNLSSYINEYLEMVRSESREYNRDVIREVVETWTKLMAPFAPHLTEEMWHQLGHNTFLSLESWPTPDNSKINDQIELEHEYHKLLIEDIRAILNVYKGKPSSVLLYVHDGSLNQVVKSALDVLNSGGTMKDFMQKNTPKSKEEARVLQRIMQYVTEMPETVKKLIYSNVNEMEVTRKGVPLLRYKLNLEIEVLAYTQEVKQKLNKDALPYRPAILVK